MPEASSVRTIAVVGAAGFVGRQLLKTMQDAGVQVTAVIRGAAELSVEGSFHNVLHESQVTESTAFDLVINLAYPNSGPLFSYAPQNRLIFAAVERLMKPGGRLIHVSTQAVFGLALDRPVSASPVRKVRDAAYVEAKIEAEHHFAALQKKGGLSLDIVRLGNVWGYASGAWALPLVQRLLTGRPIGVQGVAGLSNSTDVANVASYLSHLAIQGEGAPGLRFHHLAEFSSVPWSYWIDRLAAELQVSPVHAGPEQMTLPVSGRAELAEAMAGVKPRALYRRLAGERVSGSWARSMLTRLPRPLFVKLKGRELSLAKAMPLSREDQMFLSIMSAQQEFKSQVVAGWTPPVGQEESIRRVLGWLRQEW